SPSTGRTRSSRVHSFYCVLALLLLNLLRRKLAKAGIPLSVVEMMDTLSDTYEVTLLYPRRIWLQVALRANRPRGHGPGAAQNRREPRPRALSQRVVIQPSTRHDRASRGLESCSLSGGGKTEASATEISAFDLSRASSRAARFQAMLSWRRRLRRARI